MHETLKTIKRSVPIKRAVSSRGVHFFVASGEEREQPPDLRLVRLAAVLADLERLGEAHGFSPLRTVARDELRAEAHRGRGEAPAERVADVLLPRLARGPVLRDAARGHVAAAALVELRLHRLDHRELLLDHVVDRD